MMFEKLIARIEAFFKGMMFDCHSCGQCVLSQTGLICPMSCPKGLRNGPCGGTINGKCEVYPDKSCVWVRIRNRTMEGSFERPHLIASPDASLFNTSSYLNLFNGRGKKSRTPIPYLDFPENRTSLPLQTESKLEARLKSGAFVRTTEIRCPREADFTRFRKEASYLKNHFDAINTTAFLNGKPSIPSPRAAAELALMGISPIAQCTCRDHTKTSFVSELMNNQMNGIQNILCLTGDSYMGTPKIKQVFDMDSSLMLHEARYLREKGVIHFNGTPLKNPPRPFLGAAINPFSQPENIPILRLKQKIAAGADFVQTQAIFEFDRFTRFMELYNREGLGNDLFLLAGIPVLISKAALKMIPHIPGIHFPAAIQKRFENCGDLRQEGINFAKELAHNLRNQEGVAGIHLMLFGSDHSVLPEIITDLEA